MSITSRINEMSSHIEQAYDELQGLGADLTNVNKNIENISMVLDDIYDSMPQVSGEGTSLTLDDTRVGKIKSTLKGNTSQDGTPTPSSPIPINLVSGDNEINVVGKNFFDYRLFSNSTISGITLTNNNDGSVTINGTATATSVFEATSLVTIGENYKISGCYGGSSSTYKLDLFNPNASIFYPCFNGEETALPNNITGKVRIVVYSGTTVNNVKIYPMLSTLGGEFQPYQGNTYNIDLPEGMELCKIGNYQDYFYKDSGKWYLHKEIGKAVFNGSESWTRGNNGRFDLSLPNAALGSSSSNPILSTHFVQRYALTNYSIFLSGVAHSLSIIYQDITDDLATFKTWLSNNNTGVAYALATPTITEITYQPLIDQLNLLEKAMSKDGQTNISQVNNDLPFIISASALKEWQESTSLNSTLSMANPLSLGNTLNTQEIDNNTQPIEVDNIEPLEEEENEES